MLSPDEDFSQTGVNSGIMYAESFKKYKEMLTGDANSSIFKRVISKFNASLFGTTPVLSNNLIADDGDYDSELEQFRNELLADSPAEVVTSTGASDTFPLASLPPTPPIQLDRRVSISVTSHVLHTVAASSQVSNIISSNVTLPSEPGVKETPPQAQRKSSSQVVLLQRRRVPNLRQ